MKTNKYIQIKVQKRYMGKAYIERFMHLLDVIAPNKYELNTWNSIASIENKEFQLTVANFNDNPFKL